MSKNIRKRPGTKNWHWSFMYQGRRYAQSTGTANKREALAWAKKKEEEIMRLNLPILVPGSCRVVIDKYMEKIKRRGNAATTDHGHRLALEELACCGDLDRPVSMISTEDMQKILDDREEAGLARSTSTAKVQRWRSFLDWCVKEKYLDKNPCDDLVVRKESDATRARVYGKPQPEHIVSAIDRLWAMEDSFKWRRVATLMGLQWELALRASEACRLTPSDMRWRFNDEKQAMGLRQLRISSEQKNKSESFIPMTPEAVDYMTRWRDWADLADDEPIITRNGGGAFHSKLSSLYREAFGMLGLPTHDEDGNAVTSHSMRHARITHWAHLHPLHVVMKLSRHKKLSTVQRYLHASGDDIWHAVLNG